MDTTKASPRIGERIRITVDLPRVKHKRLRMQAVEEETSIQAIVSRLISHYLEQEQGMLQKVSK